VELYSSMRFNVDPVAHASQGTCSNLRSECITEDSQLERPFPIRGVIGILRC
jgi:hypothetical protein